MKSMEKSINRGPFWIVESPSSSSLLSTKSNALYKKSNVLYTKSIILYKKPNTFCFILYKKKKNIKETISTTISTTTTSDKRMPWSALKVSIHLFKQAYHFFLLTSSHHVVPQGLLGSLLLFYTWCLLFKLQYFHDLFLVLLTLVNCASKYFILSSV